MANEAVIITLLGNGGDPVNFSCMDGRTIEKGSILVLQDPIKVSGALTISKTEKFAGIAAHEKEASDGATTISVYTHGIFDCYVGSCPAITAGQMLVLSGANALGIAVSGDGELGKVVGKALESVAANTPETIAVLIGAGA